MPNKRPVGFLVQGRGMLRMQVARCKTCIGRPFIRNHLGATSRCLRHAGTQGYPDQCAPRGLAAPWAVGARWWRQAAGTGAWGPDKHLILEILTIRDSDPFGPADFHGHSTRATREAVIVDRQAVVNCPTTRIHQNARCSTHCVRIPREADILSVVGHQRGWHDCHQRSNCPAVTSAPQGCGDKHGCSWVHGCPITCSIGISSHRVG